MNEFNNQFGNNKKNKLKIVLSLIFTICIIVLAIIIFQFSKNKNNSGNQTANEQTKQTNNNFPPIFYSYTGIVKKIDGNIILIDANKNENYLSESTVIKISVNEKTSYSKIDVPERLGSNPKKLLSRKKISFSDIKIKDKITVIANENISGKTEIVAKTIEK